MYQQGSEDYFFRGLIRLEVSISSILQHLEERKKSVLTVIVTIAALAFVAGIAGAYILANYLTIPIKTIVHHVERIRDTENFIDLQNARLEVNTKGDDELAILGETINEMTQGLASAARAAADLTIGKEIQKKFIPLDFDLNGQKLSAGFKDTRRTQFFGYYEGAKGVSGDFYDYRDLDDRYCAIIKGDVAGKGVPAALIMIQVATLFQYYASQWQNASGNADGDDPHIEALVYQINTFIESMGFSGRFAAFTLILFDTLTGNLRICNAGDSVLHWFDASASCLKTLPLPQCPAAGALPNALIDTVASSDASDTSGDASSGGFRATTFNLDHGDILFLYTDGIQESMRHHPDGSIEMFGATRIEAVLNAVMNKTRYLLQTQSDTTLFDFTHSMGTLEEAVMALVSAEKVFRLIRRPSFTTADTVKVDRLIDTFLRLYLPDYDAAISRKRETIGEDTEIYYTNMQEDPQYDDITILGVKRK
jgi:serine phosphatase RsbU (regulator of sigma subunit)